MADIFASLGIQPIELLLNLIGFVVLFALLRKFLFGPVGNMLEHRREQIVHDRAEAARLRAAMEERQAALEERLANIESEVRDRMEAAERDAQATRETMLEEARRDRARILEAGLQELRREREKALVEIRNLVADLAMLAAGKVVEAELDLAAHRSMIDDIVEHGVR